MADRPHFMRELLRREPLGLMLWIVGLAAFAYVWFTLEPGVVSHPSLRVAVVFGFLSFAIGMPLTHGAAFRLQRERRAQDSARAPAPWER
jgi:formate-dependent nitrite reductase membrane component NrfD